MRRWYYDSSWDELDNGSYYLYYNGSTFTSSSRYSSSIYFYEAMTVYVEE
jgi:hypothetical protein